MKSNTKKIVILLTLGLVFPIILNNNFNFSVEQTTFNNLKTSSFYNGGIMIDGLATTNTTYSGNWTWAVSQPWCYDDNGVYVIEDLTINASSSPTGSGIYILDSDNEYFIIRNCNVYDAGSGLYDGGIKLEDANNGILINNNCSNNLGNGILLDTNCKNNTLSGNTVNNNSLGIYLYFCDNTMVSGNTANDNQWGIYLEESNGNTVLGNPAIGNSQHGIYATFCDYNNITGNTLNNNYDGIYLDGDCNNNTISGNNATDNVSGIVLNDSNNNTLLGNSASNNTNNGIYLLNTCTNTTISGNIASDNEVGMYIYECNYNIITGNTANDNTDREGIVLDGSNNNIVSRNTIDGNEFGIFIYDANNNTIIGNTISKNKVSGIHIDEDSDYNEFTENILRNNAIGLNINSLNENNLVYKNFFLNNGKHASDSGPANKWNSTVIGNYWDNHTTPDVSPQDGIVDSPYAFIGGSVGSVDYLPIAEDGAPIVIIHSPSAGSSFGSAAPSFNVEVIDDYLFEMWYTIDGGLNNYTFTENGIIDQSAWEALPDGSVTITFYAIDIAGNEAFEEVTVIKGVPVDGLDPGVIALIVIVSVIGGVALLGAILVILEKKGKISLEKIKKLIFRRK